MNNKFSENQKTRKVACSRYSAWLAPSRPARVPAMPWPVSLLPCARGPYCHLLSRPCLATFWTIFGTPFGLYLDTIFGHVWVPFWAVLGTFVGYVLAMLWLRSQRHVWPSTRANFGLIFDYLLTMSQDIFGHLRHHFRGIFGDTLRLF